ncbi:uncharacterized protein LOC107046397 [Diachasma alloeum]|uniref:uncharacterized protein LOC107046397 n=1 Tax=Diachasma alloeum TaxID=454923 RepID=UPI00073847B3|nr:uncharacterized protein LOC107046397 [Diachasma alloeum]
MLIQELWLLGMDWDEEVPEATHNQWQAFQAQLTLLQEISIDRYIGWTPNPQKLELHGFCDASTQAYAAVVYLRTTGHNDSLVEVKLLLGKSKVAPIQHQTVAKLELCAAHLLARVLERVKDTMELDAVPMYAWSDSQIVLAWLQKHSSHRPTFVANRVSDIQTRVPTANWRHVLTSSNPADCASREVLLAELVAHELWWSGPRWLKLESGRWLQSNKINNPLIQTVADEAETLTGCTASRATQVIDYHTTREILNLPLRCSSWQKIRRITAYCEKFLNGRRNHPTLTLKALLGKAHDFWIRQVQADGFEKQLKLLEKEQPLSPKDKLLRLNPAVDPKGILRVDGRITKASILYDERHPIRLPAGRIADLIIDDTHRRTLHGGLQLTLNTLRQRYWIINARRLVKSHIHKCVKCIRFDRNPVHQITTGNHQ